MAANFEIKTAQNEQSSMMSSGIKSKKRKVEKK
jgi:hypothetical protein